MGSLIPGWDADHIGVPPIDLQDSKVDDQAAVKGYFKKLEERKLAKQSSLGRSSLSGKSGELHPPGLSEMSSFKHICPEADGEAHVTAHLKVQQHQQPPPNLGHATHSGKYQFTDWGSELQSLGRKSFEHAKPAAATHEHTGPEHSGSWWHHMDSARMQPPSDAIPEVEEEGPSRKAQGSFRLQNPTPSHLHGLLHSDQQL